MDTTRLGENDAQKATDLAHDVNGLVNRYIDEGLSTPYAWHAVLVTLASFFSTCTDPKGAVDYAYKLLQEYVDIATPVAKTIEASYAVVN